jgi:hypothetical protein
MKTVPPILLVYFFILVLTTVSGTRMATLAGPPAEKKDIFIHWAFGALIGPENNRKLIPIIKDTTLKTGDQFKMMVELKSRCWVYLIYLGSNGEIQILFPGDIGQLNKSIQLSEKYYIPQGDLWFALDEQTGLETFYLLVSNNRLSGLEEFLKKYESLSSDKKPDMARQIVNLIKKIKRKRKTLAATPERPVQIGGTVRGVRDKPTSMHDIATLAVEISATDFYSRTFTIEHK